MKKGSRSFWTASSGIAGLLILLAILFAVNVILSGVRARADLTQQKLYTLSDGTRKLLNKLDQPVTLKLFFNSSSPDVPAYLKNYARQVEDLLKEYRIAGGRRIVVETYDPKPDSDAEEWAQRYGLAGQPLAMFGPPVYFGLVGTAGPNEAALPFLDPRMQGLLEYNLTRLIYRVGHPEKPVIGVISSLPVLGSGPPLGLPQMRSKATPAWLAFQELKQDYTVRDLTTDVDDIAKDIGVLMVVHPRELPPKTLYAIDQFVLRGGHLLAFVDPFSVANLDLEPPTGFGRPDVFSDLNPLLGAWGVSYDATKVVADTRAATKLRGANNQVEDNLAFLSLGKDNLSREDVATAQLGSLMLPFAGAFSCQASKDITVTPLIRSSPMAGPVSAMMAQFGGAAIRREFKPEPTPVNLAVRLTGRFKTAYPDGKPKQAAQNKEEGAAAPEPEPEHPGLKEGNGTVVLVGDVDLLYDRFCVEAMNFLGMTANRPINDNLSFLGNVIDQLGGSSDLIGIRSRGSFERPFTRVDKLEEKARQEWQTQEQTLEAELQDTRQRLSELQSQKDQNQRFILTPEQQEAIARFKQKEVDTNLKLRNVRKNLRQDIEQLGGRVKFWNIAAVPILLSLAGMAFGIRRKSRQ